MSQYIIGFILGTLLGFGIILTILLIYAWGDAGSHWHLPKHQKTPSGMSYGACLRCGRWDHY